MAGVEYYFNGYVKNIFPFYVTLNLGHNKFKKKILHVIHTIH